MSPEALQKFQDETHRALREAQEAISTASLEARLTVDKATNRALLLAYGRITVAAKKLDELAKETTGGEGA